MYTIVLLVALSPGQAPGQHGTGCRGCFGCYGGYPGSGYNYMAANGFQSAFSTYAPVIGGPNAIFGCHGCYGCYGGWSCYGVPLANHGYWREPVPGSVAFPQPIEQTPPPKEIVPLPKEEIPLPKLKANQGAQTRARLTLDVPAGSKVFVGGELLNMAGGKGTFQTPELTPGKTYYYDVRVELVRDGRELVEVQRVILQPGQIVTASFPNLSREANVVSVSNWHN